MSKIILTEQTAIPATPTTNRVAVYVGTDGLLRSVDDAGTVTIYAAGVTQEQVEDYVAALIAAGTGISVVYNDAGNVLTISSTVTQYTDENAQDAVGGALVDTASIDFTYNDAGNQISAIVLPAGVDHNSLQNFVANKHIDHSTVSVIAGTGLSGGGDLTASRTINLANTTVTAGAYGSATQVAAHTVDAQGRITAASNVAIQIAESQVTNLTTDLSAKADKVTTISAGTGLSGGGDLSTNRTISMPNVGTAGTYGSATQTSVITTDGQGRVSGATSTSIQIAESQVTNLVSDLAGKETAGAAAAAQAFSIQRANHTGTQPASTISDFAEATDDRVAALIVAGTNISVTYNDPANTLTIANTSTVTQYTDEQAQDAVGNALVDSASIDFTYNDVANTITAAVLPAGVNHDALQNFVANKHIDHSTVSITAGTGLTGGGDLTATRTLSLSNIGTAGTYGSSTLIPIITTDAQGRITAVTTITPAGNVFGTEYQYFQDLVASTTTGNTDVVSSTFTTTSIPAGTYQIQTTFQWRISANNSDAIFQWYIDGTAAGFEFRQELSETANQQIVSSDFFNLVFATSGTHTIELRFRNESNGPTVTVLGCKSNIWRVL